MVIPQFTMSVSNNKTLTRAEIRAREQRKIRWNGMVRYGSYEAYDNAIIARKFQRDQQRAAIKLAEENGDFVSAKRTSVATVHTEPPKQEHRARSGAFAALFVDESDDESDEESDEESVLTPAVTSSNKRSYAEAMAPTLGGNNKQEATLTKPTWFEMCASDDED